MVERVRYPVKYVTKRALRRARVCLAQYRSAGPHPNVTGMRARFWGANAAIVRHGAYIYKVPADVYNRL